MRRAALIALSLAVVLTSGTAAGARAQTAPTTAGTARTTLTICESGLLAADRYAVFSAAMTEVKGATRMWMRFDLYERTGSSSRPFKHVVVPKWGIWQKSDPGVPGFIFSKRVDGLAAPAKYRAVVHLRWYAASGKLVRSVTRTTKSCAELDPRPDLRVGTVSGTDLGDGTALYTITVANVGRGATVPFGLALSVGDGQRGATVPVDVLAAGASRPVTVEGPSCAASNTLRIVLDPDNVVDEVHEPTGPVVRSCPL